MNRLFEAVDSSSIFTESGSFLDYNNMRETSVIDFIADGSVSYADKIRFIANELEESGNVDSYDDDSWNKYLLKVASILKSASNEIDTAYSEIINK